MANAVIRSVTAGSVRTDGITSTSFITGAGLKKCMPMTRSGRPVAMAISMIGMDEVLVARTASGEATTSSRAWKISALRSNDSTTASTTRSQSPRSPISVVKDRLPRAAPWAASSSLPRSRARSRDFWIPARLRSATSGLTSRTTVGRPALAVNSATPPPICPPPTTPTRLILIAPPGSRLSNDSRQSDSVTVTDSMTTSSTGRSPGPVRTSWMAVATSTPLTTLPNSA